MRYFFFLLCTVISFIAQSQASIKPDQTIAKAGQVRKVKAVRATAGVKIDGQISEDVWKQAGIASNFYEWRPNPGKQEDEDTKSVVYFLYDNTSVYVGGFCYERSRDSISTELVGRDVVGVNDFIGVVFDTYYDKINAVGFYVTPYGEQFDAKYSNTGNEDASWNGVWESAAKIHDNGWSFEMRIPYSALRFVSSENQTWGMNITRRRNKTGQQFMWNPIDPKLNGFINQEGEWTGIGKIETPTRLSFSPYFAAYLNHYPTGLKGKDLTSSINGGMDLKYGISDAFTLDMTLIPDFGQVRSDNQVLNLTPFEVKYNENRSFFTEGTELFNKGNLFYSRRIGGRPVNYGKAYENLGSNEYVLSNPSESKLINATKISGRTKDGLGLGFFNSLSKSMYAVIEDSITHEKREVETSALTNYNIIVADQNLKNNSAISFINTSTIRNGDDYDANVSAVVFNLNNRSNTYGVNGKFGMSQIFNDGKSTRGYSHNIGFGKNRGRWNFQVGQELADAHYDINDMALLFNNNYVDHYFWTGYRWLQPKRWYNRIQVNYNAYFSQLLTPIKDQKIDRKFQAFNTNVNANMQLKNLWFVGGLVSYSANGNDFYEPRTEGYSYRTPAKLQLNGWFETNRAKSYYGSFNYFFAKRNLFNSLSHTVSLSHTFRFNDKLSVSQELALSLMKNDAGFYDKFFDGDNLVDIIFSNRDRKTIENVISAKYNFNNKSGITFRARHYSSSVEQNKLFDLNSDGTLSETRHPSVEMLNRSFNIFNIDAVYTWQFAPGSFVNIVWKDESLVSRNEVEKGYFKNINNILGQPQNNNLSVKVIYYLNYLYLKKKK